MEDELTEIELENISFISNRFKPLERLGEGSFSTVIKAEDLSRNRMVAIKIITKTSAPSRILEEITFLKNLGGKDNCMGLYEVLRNEDQVVVVTPYFEATDFREFLSSANSSDIKRYIYNLLIAINHVHSNNIIHRDIKPSNFLYNKEIGRGMLIDFGLAQKNDNMNVPLNGKIGEKPETPVLFFNSIVSKTKPPGFYENDSRPSMKANRAGTRGFRAPEVLFRYQFQTKALDIWSIGVIFLTLLTTQYPFFYSSDDIEAIVEIGTIFGHSEMRRAAKLYGRVWKSNIDTIPEKRIPFETIVESLNPWCDIGTDGYNLLYKMLDLNSNERITAEKALQHKFFDNI